MRSRLGYLAEANGVGGGASLGIGGLGVSPGWRRTFQWYSRAVAVQANLASKSMRPLPALMGLSCSTLPCPVRRQGFYQAMCLQECEVLLAGLA